MTEKQILTQKKALYYAQAHYPVGTKFKSPQSGSIFTVDSFVPRAIDKWRSNYKGTEVRVKIKDYDAYLLYDGKWAEIIEPAKPKDGIINNYSIW